MKLPSIPPFLLLGTLLICPGGISAHPLDWFQEPHRVAPGAVAETSGGSGFSVELIIDDGTAEGDFGVGGLTAQQFLWLNRMTGPRLFHLQEIQVLFPAAGGDLDVGAAIDLVVYQDVDGDPTNGAELLGVFPASVQVADGVTFSRYPIELDKVLGPGGDVYLGVIPRFIVSGTSAPVAPAALDTSNSQGRSWLAVWTTDPPAMPELPADGLVAPIDDLVAGNWMIRGFGSPASVAEIPTVGGSGWWLTLFLTLLAGLVALRRR